MRIKKKASKETLSLLVSILVTILILTPIIVIGYRALAEKGATEKCYKDIIEAAKGLPDEKNVTVLCQLELTAGIVGFDAGVNTLELKGVPVTVSDLSLKGVGEQFTGKGGVISSKDMVLNKPSQCNDNNLACICLCSLNQKGIQDDRKVDCKSAPKCTQLPSIKEMKGVYTPYAKQSYNTHLGGMFIFARKGLFGIHLSKYRDLLYVCESGKSCENQIVKSLSESDEEKELKSQFNNIQKLCKDSKDCLCGNILADKGVNNFEILKERSNKSYVIANTKDFKIKLYESSSDLCVYKDKKKFNVSKTEQKVELKNLRILKLNNQFCFTDEVDAVTKACFEKVLDYTQLKESCLDNKEEKCSCKENLKVKFVEDKINEYLIRTVEEKVLLVVDLKQSQEVVVEDIGKEVCFYDGKDVKDVKEYFEIIQNPLVDPSAYITPFRFKELKLVKVGDNVCFSNVTSYANCGSEPISSTVPLR